MATNLPQTLPEFIDWANAHSSLWTTNQAQIGISADQLQTYKTLTTALNTAKAAADLARQNSKNATLTQNDAESILRTVAGALVNTIKAFAETSNNDKVYALAGVSPDAPRGVVPPPIPPTNFTASINGGGSLTLKWKVTQPSGVNNVQYRVLRRVNATGPGTPFTLVGTAGKSKAFTDETLPFGVDRVDYIIQPYRGETPGPQSNIFSVQFGSVIGDGSGSGSGSFQITATSTQPNTQPMKVAA